MPSPQLNPGTGAEFPYLSDYVQNVVLAAAVAETITVPADANGVLFGADGDFYVRLGGTATVPAADVAVGSGMCLNPTARRVAASSTFSIIASAARVVALEWQRIQ